MTSKQYFAFSQPLQNFLKFGDQFAGVYMFWTDVNCVYIGCDDQTAAAAGLAKQELLGLHPKDCIWGEYAEIYCKNIEAVLNTRATHCFCKPGKHCIEGRTSLLNFETPLTDLSGWLEGVFLIAIELERYSLLEIVKLINQFGILMFDPRLLPLPNQKEVQQLTKREQECLFHVVHGKSAKEVARLLMCSHRTIESHIENIKTKLHCHTRSQLIDKVMQQNY